MFGLMSYKAAKVASDDAVPRGIVLLLELLSNERRDVLLHEVYLLGLLSDLDCVQLHLLSHVCVLNVTVKGVPGPFILH